VGFRDQRTTPRGLAAARRLGLETTVYTVNAPARMRELAALGVTGIFTDRPDLALQVLRPG
jgi:glycerophosphoryl diester phosphodiesterase